MNSSFDLDHWPKIIAAAFAALAVASIGFTNSGALVLSVGGLLFGVGEIINHSRVTKIIGPEQTGVPGQYFKGEGYERANTTYGLLLAVVGALLFFAGIIKVFLQAN